MPGNTQYGGGPIGSSSSSSSPHIPFTSQPLYSAISNMMSCIDLSNSSAQAAAHAMEVQLPKWFRVTGRVTALAGIADNLTQLKVEGFNWNDAAQIAVGAALIGFSSSLGAPVVFVGGLGLFIWELAETYNAAPPATPAYHDPLPGQGPPIYKSPSGMQYTDPAEVKEFLKRQARERLQHGEN